MMAFGGWNEATIAALRGLWAEGLGTSEIARRLGATKNGIVGKAHRLGLESRPSPITRLPGGPREPYVRRDRAVTGTPRRAAGPGVAAPPPRPAAPPIIRRTRRPEPCCAPVGTPGRVGFRFCEEPTSGRYRAPYCDLHALQFLRPVRVEAAHAA